MMVVVGGGGRASLYFEPILFHFSDFFLNIFFRFPKYMCQIFSKYFFSDFLKKEKRSVFFLKKPSQDITIFG